MAGLLEQPQQMPQQQIPPQQGQQMPPQQAPQKQGRQRKPGRDYKQNPLGEADKEQLQMVQINAAKLIHAKETRDAVLKAMKSKSDPVRALSDVAAMIVARLEAEMPEVDPLILLHGLNLIIADLADTAVKLGVFPEVSKEQRQQALSRAIQEITKKKMASGEVSPQEMQQVVQSVGGQQQTQQQQQQMQPAGGVNGELS